MRPNVNKIIILLSAASVHAAMVDAAPVPWAALGSVALQACAQSVVPPPTTPEKTPPEAPPSTATAEPMVDQTLMLLEHLHREVEAKANELEAQGVVVVYGEDGQPVDETSAHHGRSRVNIKRSWGTSTARMGLWVGLLLLIGYLVLRGQMGRMAAR